MAKTLMRERSDVPSIRAIARALNVDAMAIYHYFDNKNSLLNAILISLMDSLYFPQKQLAWKDSLFLLSKSYINLLRNYRGLLETLIAMPAGGPLGIFSDHFNKIISPLNLSPEKQKHTFQLLLNFLHGFALLPFEECAEDDFLQLLRLYCKTIED